MILRFWFLLCFLPSDISDINAETKNSCNQKTSKCISARNDQKIALLQNQIIYLRGECNSKNQLINLILENAFKSNIPKVTSYTNSNILLTQMTILNFLKDLVKTTIRKVLITASLMIIDFMLFLLTSTANITMKIYTLQSHQVKHHILKTPGNSNFRELNSERGKKAGVITVQLTLHRKTLEPAASCKSDSNHISISGIVPLRDKLNGKAAQVNSFLKNECSKRNVIKVEFTEIKVKPIGWLKICYLLRVNLTYDIKRR